jgi:hypothetical protein
MARNSTTNLRLNTCSGLFRHVTTRARYRVVFILALAMMLCGCAHSPASGARLSSTDAIRIAKEAAKRDGRKLVHYQYPEARYYREDGSWFVAFKGRGWVIFSKAGDHFAVHIDDLTGEARISGGM